jgi:hypothetical protein
MSDNTRDWLGDYLNYTQHSEAPDSFHLWTGIGVIAGALRRRVFIDMGYFKWFPNFFITFVAPPGIAGKSTTADIGMRLLRNVEGINFGPSSVTWQKLVSILAECGEDFPISGLPITPQTEFMRMSAVTVVASELGTFLDPDDRKSIDTIVSLWDSIEGTWGKGTKGEGVEEIVNPWFQLIGCTTPSWIAENMSNYFIGGGFASRTLFVYADVKRRLVAYPAEKIPKNHDEFTLQLTKSLTHIATLVGRYELSAEAKQWGRTWYENHFSADNPLRKDSRLGGYFARKQTHIHKTAMVRAASLRDQLVITVEDLIWADNEVTKLEASMLRVFGEMNKEEIVAVQNMILDEIIVARKIRKDELFRSHILTIGYETFEAALTALFGGGLVVLETNGAVTHLVATEAALAGKIGQPAQQSRPPLRLV